MKTRIYVRYGAQDYAVTDRSLAELRTEIESAVATSGWIPVYFGEGRATRTELLMTPGVSVSIREETEPEPEPAQEPKPEHEQA